MFSIDSFSLQDMTDLSNELRELGGGARSQEEVARRITNHFYDEFTMGAQSEKAFAMVRCFISLSFRDLEAPLKRYVEKRRSQMAEIKPDTRCLTLIATRGHEEQWNERHLSTNHRAIPIDSPSLEAELPMIALLLKQFGIESNSVSDVVLNFPGQDTPTSVGIDEIVMDQDQATFNVFFVPNAVDSPYIYQQEDFVKPYGVKSVLGFGGILSAGQIFAILLFSKAIIKKEIAQRFKPLALSTKNALLQAPPDKVFSLSDLS